MNWRATTAPQPALDASWRAAAGRMPGWRADGRAVDAAGAGATIGQLDIGPRPPGAERGSRRHPGRAPFASAFEELRDASDAFAARHGHKRPRVFLAGVGSIAERVIARKTYAMNFFEAGGFEVLANDGVLPTRSRRRRVRRRAARRSPSSARPTSCTRPALAIRTAS